MPSSPAVQLQFAIAFENAAIGMALLGPDGWQRLRLNRAYCEMLGYAEQELLHPASVEITHPDDVAEDRRQRAGLLAGDGTAYQREKRYLHRNGHVVWALQSVTLARDSAGAPLHFILQVQDITERKLAENALRRSEERFRSLTMLSSDWYWEQDAQFRFTSFSGDAKAASMPADLGVDIGKRRWELDGMRPLQGTWAEHRAVLEAHQPFRDFEFVRVRAAEPIRYLCASGEPVFDAAGRLAGYRGTARDITRAKLAEQHLREAQAMLGMAAQVGRLGGWAHDVGEPTVTWSAEVCLIHEVPLGLRPTPSQALAFFAPQDRERMRGVLRACMTDGSPFDVEAQIVTAKGRPLWVRLICEAEWDARGRVRRVQGAVQDVTERMAAQQEILRLNAELEERVRQRTAELEGANKELEAFSYSIAHDLRAPLGSIEGFSQMLEQAAGRELGGRNLHYLHRIRAGVRQMAGLTDGLLALANLSRASLRSEPVDLTILAVNALAACREKEPGRVVEARVAATPPVQGDPRLLSQVMANLVENAWKFTSKTGHARIEVGWEPAGTEVVYFVRDNGAGFDMAYSARMFDAFHRMHTAGEFEGTGIGLAIVQKIVTRHGGRIWAQAAPQAGASFYLTLPAAAP